MDSPFGRLSMSHKKNVVNELPNMSRQVMLFIYDGEVNKEDLKKLGDKLVKEYYLEHETAFQTNVEEGK